MSKMMKTWSFIGLLLLLCVPTFAQNKIAVIDVNAFFDEKSGVKELVGANKKLEEEFKSDNETLKVLNKRLEELAIYFKRFETTDFSESYFKENKEKHEKMYLEIQVLPNKIKAKTDELIPRIEKRKSEIVEPVNKRIGEKLKEFAKQKGFTSIFEASKFGLSEKSGCVCYQGICILYIDYPDITNEFIKFCNEEFEKEKVKK